MKMKLIKNAVLTGSLLVGCSSMAFADLQIYSANVERSKNEAKADGRYGFIQTGVSGEKANVVGGFSNSMGLMTSLQGIVPKNSWRIDVNEGAENILVSWKGGLPWPYVLEDLARQNNLKISVDWNTKVVEAYSQDVAIANEAKRVAAEKIAKEIEMKKIADKALSDKLVAEKLLKEKEAAALKSIKDKEALARSELKSKEAEIAKNLKRERDEAARLDRVRIANDKAMAESNKVRYRESNEYFRSIITTDKEKSKTRDKNKSASSGLSDMDLYNLSNVRPADGNMRNLIDSVHSKRFNEKTEAIFILKAGTMLSENLNIWSNVADWSFERNSKVDFMITRDIVIKGNLENAVQKTVLMYIESTKPIKIEMHRANNVLEMKDFIFTSKQVGGERIGSQK